MQQQEARFFSCLHLDITSSSQNSSSKIQEDTITTINALNFAIIEIIDECCSNQTNNILLNTTSEIKKHSLPLLDKTMDKDITTKVRTTFQKSEAHAIQMRLTFLQQKRREAQEHAEDKTLASR